MDSEAARRLVFKQLQPLCSSLLLHRSDAQALSGALLELFALLQTVDEAGLLDCSDYSLFPLLFIVDSTYALRNETGKYALADACLTMLSYACCKNPEQSAH